EVLNVLDVFGICSQLRYQAVVVRMRVLAQRLIAFEHDDGCAVGVELAELLPDVLHGHDRRRIRGVQGHRTLGTDDLELGHQHVRYAGNRDPDQNDRQGECADDTRCPRTVGALCPVLTHAVLSRQAMYPFTSLEDLSSLTTPLTVMRQVMLLESPW